MSSRRKSFQGGRPITDFEPVEFQLNDQTFTCKPALQGAVLLEFVSHADSESGGAQAGALYGLFEDCMEPKEYERFRAYLNQPDLIIEMTTIGDIASWLVEEYTARPTQQPENSASGLQNPGPMSTEQQFSVA